MGRWNGFYNKSTFILYNMIFGAGKTSHIDQIREASELPDGGLQLQRVLENIYYGALHSKTSNAIKRRHEEVPEPINWGELAIKVRTKLIRDESPN